MSPFEHHSTKFKIHLKIIVLLILVIAMAGISTDIATKITVMSANARNAEKYLAASYTLGWIIVAIIIGIFIMTTYEDRESTANSRIIFLLMSFAIHLMSFLLVLAQRQLKNGADAQNNEKYAVRITWLYGFGFGVAGFISFYETYEIYKSKRVDTRIIKTDSREIARQTAKIQKLEQEISTAGKGRLPPPLNPPRSLDNDDLLKPDFKYLDEQNSRKSKSFPKTSKNRFPVGSPSERNDGLQERLNMMRANDSAVKPAETPQTQNSRTRSSSQIAAFSPFQPPRKRADSSIQITSQEPRQTVNEVAGPPEALPDMSDADRAFVENLNVTNSLKGQLAKTQNEIQQRRQNAGSLQEDMRFLANENANANTKGASKGEREAIQKELNEAIAQNRKNTNELRAFQDRAEQMKTAIKARERSQQ